MSTPNEGSALSAELQGQVEELASTQQQGQVTQTQEGQSTETTTETQQPDVTALQKELADLRQRAEQNEKRFQDTQAAYTRSQQALRAYVGGQEAPANPVEQLAKNIMAKGKLASNMEQARALAEVMYEGSIAPMQQQLQSQQLMMHNQAQLDTVMQNIYSSHPQVLSDPQIYREVENGLRQQALDYARQGQPWDAQSATEYAKIYAAQQWGLKQFNGAGNTPPAQQNLHPMAIRSQFGPMGNFTGPQSQQQKQQDTPAMIEMQKRLDAQFKTK